MRIYFCASVRGGRGDSDRYQEIVALLRRYGEVLTGHLADATLTGAGEEAFDDRRIYQRDSAWLGACDVVVAEVSVPSLGVGMELGHADTSGKPTLCLYSRDAAWKLSAMVAGCPRFTVERYAAVQELPPILARFFARA